ncbi:MAG: hypothetical protein HUJ11_05395, partial [Arenibacter algicola]|nr:hypothetical protein [Arenibacter algicola]
MRFAVLFFTVAFLISCSESDNAVLSGSSLQLDHDSVSGDSYSISDWDSALGAPAQLINRLPQGTLAYLRIPTLWGLIGTPKGNSLSPALASEANQEQIKELQSALSQEVASALPESLEPIIETFLDRLRSPLEIAVVSSEQVDPGGIVIVLGGQMEFSTLELFNVFLAEATGQNQDLVLLPDGQNSGAGIMSLSGLTVQYDYDFSSKYLTAVVGQEASRAQLQSVLAWTETPNSMSVRSMEQRIDSAGYGFFIWMDMHQSFPALEPFIESQLSAGLNTEAMFGIRSLALGEGVVGEKGRLSLILEGSDSVLFDSTLPAAPKIDFPIVGEPRNLVSIRIPNRGWIESMSSLVVAAEDFPGISEELERGDI